MSNEFFRDGQWLDAHGGLVEPHTAEEYFSGSQWYDRTCLNEQWKIQGVQPTDEVRSRSAGIEYRMVHLQPPVLYVLRKERREGGQDARALGSYYIADCGTNVRNLSNFIREIVVSSRDTGAS